jgi:hypothetical protein
MLQIYLKHNKKLIFLTLETIVSKRKKKEINPKCEKKNSIIIAIKCACVYYVKYLFLLWRRIILLVGQSKLFFFLSSFSYSIVWIKLLFLLFAKHTHTYKVIELMCNISTCCYLLNINISFGFVWIQNEEIN